MVKSHEKLFQWAEFIECTSTAVIAAAFDTPTTHKIHNNWAPSSEFVSSSIPSWQTLTAHAQPFRGARDLAFCLKVPLDSLLVWASSEGSGETARMRRRAWTFAARICDKYQIRLTRSNYDLAIIFTTSKDNKSTVLFFRPVCLIHNTNQNLVWTC